MSASWLNAGDTVAGFNALRCFARAWGEVNSLGISEAEAALETLWKSRCTVAEFANGLS
jgi:hypothetical protein